MTSLASKWIEDNAAKDGAMVYCSKPSTLDELLKLGVVVRNMLDQHGRGAGNPVPEQ